MAKNAALNNNAGFVITPSTNFATKLTCYRIYVGGTGGQSKNVQIKDGLGNILAFKGLLVGTYIDGIMITGVSATNTTSTASLIGYGPQ